MQIKLDILEITADEVVNEALTELFSVLSTALRHPDITLIIEFDSYWATTMTITFPTSKYRDTIGCITLG